MRKADLNHAAHQACGLTWKVVRGRQCRTHCASRGFLLPGFSGSSCAWKSLAAGQQVPGFILSHICVVEHSLKNAALETCERCLQTFVKLYIPKCP